MKGKNHGCSVLNRFVEGVNQDGHGSVTLPGMQCVWMAGTSCFGSIVFEIVLNEIVS